MVLQIDWINLIIAIFTAVAAVCAAVSASTSERQVKKLPQSLQSSTYQSLVTQFDNFVKEIINRPRMASILYEENGGSTLNLSVDEKAQATWLGFLYLTWAEAVVIQSQQLELIPMEVWKHWKKTIREDVSKGYLAEIWANNKDFYHAALKQTIETPEL